jgi:hypothetical protein
MNNWQDKFYQEVLKRDKELCIRAAFSMILLGAIVGLVNFHLVTFLFIVGCTAVGAFLGSLFCFALFRYLRRRYEHTFLHSQKPRIDKVV